MRRIFLNALLPLAACATPLEQCINNVSKDIRILEGLIGTTQSNINRGYAIQTVNFFENEVQVCGEIKGDPVFCNVPVAQTREVPHAIDLNAEQAKLNSLLAKRSELSQSAPSKISQCRAAHPET